VLVFHCFISMAYETYTQAPRIQRNTYTCGIQYFNIRIKTKWHCYFMEHAHHLTVVCTLKCTNKTWQSYLHHLWICHCLYLHPNSWIRMATYTHSPARVHIYMLHTPPSQELWSCQHTYTTFTSPLHNAPP